MTVKKYIHTPSRRAVYDYLDDMGWIMVGVIIGKSGYDGWSALFPWVFVVLGMSVVAAIIKPRGEE